MHPDDLERVSRCEAIIAEHAFNSEDTPTVGDYKYVYYFRQLHADGRYIPILHQALPISCDAFGRVSKVLCIEVDISGWNAPLNQHVSIIGLKDKPSRIGIRTDVDSQIPETRPTSALTSRELEVIRLFSDGYTANEIARLLHLSEGTVRTHRQNSLNKTNCRNMTALVAQCIRDGLA